jgi:hypothetical protein
MRAVMANIYAGWQNEPTNQPKDLTTRESRRLPPVGSARAVFGSFACCCNKKKQKSNGYSSGRTIILKDLIAS